MYAKKVFLSSVLVLGMVGYGYGMEGNENAGTETAGVGDGFRAEKIAAAKLCKCIM